jgi:hypothetical protein
MDMVTQGNRSRFDSDSDAPTLDLDSMAGIAAVT